MGHTGPVQQRGVGLIEILIALLVLTIGFLAAARMQVEGMRFSQSAYYNSQAYFMASDIIDRMRANIDGVSDGEYDGNFQTSAASANPNCGDNPCTPAELAQQDLFDWSVHLHPALAGIDATPALPSADGIEARAEVLSDGAGQYTVNVFWAEVVDNTLQEERLAVSFVSEERQ